MADALMKWETIDKNQIDDLMAGKEPRPPLDESDASGRTTLQKSDKGDDRNINIGRPVGGQI
jgi:cell division protease FtsH